MKDQRRRICVNALLLTQVLATNIALMMPGQMAGQTFTTLYSFSSTSDGAVPDGGLILSGNTLYGTASEGGTWGWGTVFKINADGSDYSTIYNFTNGSDEANPDAGLILSGNILYGTTLGDQQGTTFGTVFKVNIDGTGFTTLYSFAGGTDGGYPQGDLVLSGNMLYGTAVYSEFETGLGGGTVFEVTTNGTGFTTLHSFIGSPLYPETNTDGQSPVGLLLSGNTLYGTTSGGGMQFGTVFAVNTNGTGFKSLYVFTGQNEGDSPQAGLIISGNTLYGTSAGNDGFGGGTVDVNTNGSVFSLQIDGTDFSILHSFTATSGSAFTNADGANPSAGLILSGNTLYGTAPYGGSFGDGTVFSVNTNGTGFKTLYDFSGNTVVLNQFTLYVSGLILSGNSLYGAMGGGGSFSNGMAFAVSTNGTRFAPLHNFAGTSINSDGADPGAGLILYGDLLYGTATQGGNSGNGTMFVVNTNGTCLTTLHSFNAVSYNSSIRGDTNSDGADPQASLVLAGNTLYGTAGSGGSGGSGTVFAFATNGNGFTTLHSFAAADFDSSSRDYTNSDGAYPQAGLILSGNTLYGTTIYGTTNGNGAVFAINTDGTGFTTLHSFTPGPASGTLTNGDGAYPKGGLILSGNVLYGTASAGGSSGVGTLFAINAGGTGFTTLHVFTNGSDGANPYASLILSGNTLYGIASGGGSSGNGTVFKVGTDGNGFTTLYAFSETDTNGFNNDGAYPYASLILSSNTLFGTASFGGSFGHGTVFAVNTDGSGFTTLHTFSDTNANDFNTDGAYPYASLVLSGKSLYGTTSGAGASGNGTVFNISLSSVGAEQGSLQATIAPSAAVSAGAHWQVDGGTDQESGATVTNIAKGSHTVSFTSISGWNAPASQSVAITNGATTTVTGVYTLVAPNLDGITPSGTNLVLSGINGQSGGTYYLLMSTNLALPLNQWKPVATNVLSASGNFTITAINTVTPNVPQRFFILEQQ